jgi:hypothetical protein
MPPHVRLIDMSTAASVSMIVHAAAKFGLADHLANGPMTAEALAGPTGTHAPSLYRLMRTLSGLGILSEDSAHRFSLTPLGEALKSDAPGAARATILTMAGEQLWLTMQMFPYAVETGRSGWEKATGLSFFDWLERHPAEASRFSEAMRGFHGNEPPAVAEAYDFRPFATIVDVGGATGHMLTTLLGSYTEPRGVLFDLPHCEQNARALIASRALTDRITLKVGSFFESVPEGGDAYLLSHVIHDWNEDQCLEILGNCRRAMRSGGRLLLVETVLPPGNVMHPGKILDMIMLAGLGGQERTEAEYRALLDKAGFQLTRVVPTKSAVSVIEATVLD